MGTSSRLTLRAASKSSQTCTSPRVRGAQCGSRSAAMNNPALLIASALTIPLSFALSGPANLTHASECPEDAPWCSVDDEIHGGLDDVDFVDVRRAPDPRVYAYTAKCFTEYFTRVADYCDRDGYIPEPDMPCDDEEVLAPRWSRPREQSDEHWTLDRTFTCPGDDGFPFSSSD